MKRGQAMLIYIGLLFAIFFYFLCKWGFRILAIKIIIQGIEQSKNNLKKEINKFKGDMKK